MSTARKITPSSSAPDHHSLVDSARQHHASCCSGVTTAEAAVAAARAALVAAPRDPQERALARESLTMAEEDLTAAQAGKCSAEQRLQAAERSRDEAEASALGERVSRAEQMRALDAIADAFESHVVAGLKSFFTVVTDSHSRFQADASALNAVWRRLGHEHRLAGVDLAHGTGTAEIPPVVSLDTVRAYSSALGRRLEQRRQSPELDRITRAALLFLDGALDSEKRTHLALRELDLAMHESNGGAR